MRIGGYEILLVLILALLIFGPKRLPDIARQVGRAIREVRKVSSEFEREVRTSFALDEHHSTYVTPKQQDGAPAAANGEQAQPPPPAADEAEEQPRPGPDPDPPGSTA